MSIPDDVAAELERLRAANAQLLERAEKAEKKVFKLSKELDALKHQLFGRKSEKVDPRQLRISFDRAVEDAADYEPLEDAPYPAEELAKLEQAEAAESKTDSGRRRRTRIPDDLPSEREELHPTEEQLVCACGCQKVRMGEEVSRRLEVIPARFYWKERVRVKYACPRGCGIVRPALPPEPIERGLAGPSLLAELLINKYDDHLPLNRLERIFSRDDVELSKSTLGSWVEQSTGLLEPIAEAVHRAVLARPVVQTDETGILVLDRKHPEGRFKGRMWVYCGEQGELSYAFTPTKESKWPVAHLHGFEGTLQADAYPGFDTLFADGSIVEAGCNAHARRRFKLASDQEPKRDAAKYALLAYHQLYLVEREAKAKQLSAKERYELRQRESKPIVETLYDYLEKLSGKLRPTDPLHDAVSYAIRHKEALTHFLEDGRVEIDNNRSERSLRQVAVGRNNWLFAGSPRGATSAAIAYTLIMSCRELGVSTRDYLIDVLDRVSTHPAARIDELTPRGWAAARAEA